jgi:hypothetical protein
MANGPIQSCGRAETIMTRCSERCVSQRDHCEVRSRLPSPLTHLCSYGVKWPASILDILPGVNAEDSRETRFLFSAGVTSPVPLGRPQQATLTWQPQSLME